LNQKRSSQEIRITGGGLEFSGQADGPGSIDAKEIQGQAAQEGEVLSGGARHEEHGHGGKKSHDASDGFLGSNVAQRTAHLQGHIPLAFLMLLERI
jgi:hypothetical protein